MSERKNDSNGMRPEGQTNGNPASQHHQEKAEHFRLDLDDQRVDADLKMNSKELRSRSDGKGPVSPETFQAPAQKQPQTSYTRSPEQMWKDHKKRSRRKGRKNRWFFRGVWLSVLILIGIGIAQFAITCLNDLLAFGKPSNTVTVELKKGATTEEIADALIEQDVIRNKWAFCMYSKFTKSDDLYEYGTFQLTTDMDYEALINTLQVSTSRLDTVTITFQEGMQVTEIGAKLEEAGVCTKEEFQAAANNKELFSNYEFISDIKNGDERAYFLEGYLFPDTYDFYKGEGAENAIEKMLNNTNDKLTSDLYKAAEKADMTMDEVITMASMLQAEAASKKDMAVISSIFHNRLEAGVSGGFGYLNSDPTIWYPYLSEEDMPDGYDGDYNTYTHIGLPIGPICNPGLSAIKAVLEPEDTDYYYFCHAKDGTPYYAETEWEHENNKAAAGLS